MKRNIIVLIFILFNSTLLLHSQISNQDRLNAYKIAFYTQRLKLTPAESEKFWPVYNEFQEEKTRIQQERVQIYRRINQESASMSAKELTDLGDRHVRLEVLEAELSLKLHTQVKGILPPIKVLRLYQVENQYRQVLLQELQERRQDRNIKFPY